MYVGDATTHRTEYSFTVRSQLLTCAYDISDATKFPICIINIQLYTNLLIFKYYIINTRIVCTSHYDNATITDGTGIATDLISN
jgi:hypothetical protein